MAMTLRLDEKTEAELNELSEQLGTNKTQVVQAAVHEMAARRLHKAKVRAAFEMVRTRDAELLELLSR